MIHFAWPIVFCLLPLPFFVRQLSRRAGQENSAAIKVPFFKEIKELSKGTGSFSTSRTQDLLWFLWLLLLTAAARPQMPDGIQNYTVPVRDIVLVVDISRSMLQKDMGQEEKSRLDIVKKAASTFISKRKNDRLGIVLFAEQTNLYMPLTVDIKALNRMLSGVQAGLLGSLTAIGDALGLSLRYLEKSQAKHKIVVLLTDGVNNAGNIVPADALQAAKQHGVTVYTIGVGTEQAHGAGIDAAFLRQVADETGGLFFMADDDTALEQAYERISRNEPLSEASVYLLNQKELYFWPLSVFAAVISFFVFKHVARRATFGRGGD